MKTKFKDTPAYEEAKKKIKALKDLLIKQDFEIITGLCCSSCSVNALETDKQYMFYHRQDEETFKKEGYLYLAFGWGGEEIDESGDAATGATICEAAGECDIPVVWNGSPYKRIKLVFAI
jgi:hypothetical protein